MVRYRYEGSLAATAVTVDDDGWLLTGDLARRDAQVETVWVLDRPTDTTDISALSASPVEVEAALPDAPGVVDAAGVGTPDTVLA